MSQAQPTELRMTDHSRPEPLRSIPQLCERCQVLVFDDAALGGYEYVLDDGRRTLRFGENISSTSPTLKALHYVDLGYYYEDEIPNFPGLAESAEAGCSFCGFLRRALLSELRSINLNGVSGKLSLVMDYVWFSERRDALRDSYGPKLFQEMLSSNEYDHVLSYLSIRANVQIEGQSRPRGLKFCFNVEGCKDECDTWLGLYPRLPSSALHNKNLAWMRQKIQHCSARCGRRLHQPGKSTGTATKGSLPSRLMDLSNYPSWRLVVPGNQLSDQDLEKSSGYKYAALSYCWGPANDSAAMLKLTEDNLTELLNGPATNSLTPVVGDTVEVCHKLGIRYLWVDALCIVQGDESEFHSAASQLKSIFENATVTIVALASNSCNDRYLERTHAAVRIPFRSKVHPGLQGTYELGYLPHRGNISLLPTRPKYHLDLYTSEWDSRGWTWIEEKSSTRLLYFGTSMVHYECRHCGVQSESDKTSIPSGPMSPYALEYDSQDSWAEIMCSLSDHHFTKPPDRLSAMSELAKVFAAHHGDRYLAGLWKGNLPFALLWFSSAKDKWQDFLIKVCDPCPYVAPSWTWASGICQTYVDYHPPTLRGVFNINSANLQAEFDFVDYAADFVSRDPFGAIKSAYLMLDGKLSSLPSVLKPSGIHEIVQMYMEGVLLGVCQLDWNHEDWVGGIEDTYMVPRQDLMMLLVASRREIPTSQVSDVEEIGAFGLVLMPTGHADEYYRVGVFSLLQHGEYPDEAPWDNVLFKGKQKRRIRLI